MDLEAIKRRHASATPGPWHWNGDYVGMLDDEAVPHWVLETVDLNHIGYIAMLPGGFEQSSRNIEFAAHAWDDIKDLLAEVEELRAWKSATQRLQDREWYGDLTPEEVEAEDKHWNEVFKEEGKEDVQGT